MADKVKNESGLSAGVLQTLQGALPDFQVTEGPSSPKATWDLTVTLRSGKTMRRVLVECKSVGEPRYLAQAITLLKLAARTLPRSYPVVAVPYIGRQGQRLPVRSTYPTPASPRYGAQPPMSTSASR